MIHFRLRRRMRHLTDSLSLQSVFSSLHPRSVLTSAWHSGWHGRQRLYATELRLRLSGIRGLGSRRSGALFGVLIAISLEVCGCELQQNYRSYSGSQNPGSVMLRPLLPERRLSFYDPVDQDEETASFSRTGRDLLPPVRPPLSQAKPLPWDIPESVYFVYKGGDTGSSDPARQPIATAFVLSIPDHEHRHYVRFFVTARHVVDPEWARCSQKNPSSIRLRLNRRSGGIGYVNVPLVSRVMRRYFTPMDPTADLAIIPIEDGLIANLDEYKIIEVPFRLLPTDAEMLQFRADQPVITARVPAWPSNGSGSFPAFDAGVLSKMPAETVKVQCSTAVERQPAKSLHVWFINAGTPQGASGAPVYTAIARGSESAKTTVLLGIQSVAWPDEGAAGITPSVVLRDLVQTALRKQRSALDFYKGPDQWPQETASIY